MSWYRTSGVAARSIIGPFGWEALGQGRGRGRNQEYLSDQIHSDPKDLFLNLAELSFIDSSGLSVLLNTRELLQSFDRSLVLVSPSQVVERVLTVTGLNEIFEIDTGKAEYAVAQDSA